MKIILKIVLSGGLAYYATHFFPWWSIAVTSGLVFFAIPSKLFVSFLSGFFSLGALWFWLSWSMHAQTKGFLSQKVSQIFDLPNPFYLILITGLVGGFVGGMAALTGSSLRRLLAGKHKRTF